MASASPKNDALPTAKLSVQHGSRFDSVRKIPLQVLPDILQAGSAQTPAQPFKIKQPIANEFQEELLIMTSMRHVKNSSIASEPIPWSWPSMLRLARCRYNSKTGPKNEPNDEKRALIRSIRFGTRDLLW